MWALIACQHKLYILYLIFDPLLLTIYPWIVHIHNFVLVDEFDQLQSSYLVLVGKTAIVNYYHGLLIVYFGLYMC